MISYAILTHNEGEYIERLLQQLDTLRDRTSSEIVVVDDYSSDPLTRAILEEWEAMEVIRLFRRELGGDFAAQKNYLTECCRGDVIFQIDADELAPEALVRNLREIVDTNPHVDVFLVPRINRVEGLEPHHAAKWGWKVDEGGLVNWPDYQWRIFRNHKGIRYANRVHERLVGFDKYSLLPKSEEWALIHDKEIGRQEAQNAFYDTLG